MTKTRLTMNEVCRKIDWVHAYSNRICWFPDQLAVVVHLKFSENLAGNFLFAGQKGMLTFNEATRYGTNPQLKSFASEYEIQFESVSCEEYEHDKRKTLLTLSGIISDGMGILDYLTVRVGAEYATWIPKVDDE